MSTLIQIFKELQATNGKKEKQEIISRHINYDIFVKCMKFLLNDFIVTGISDNKIDKDISMVDDYRKIYLLESSIDYLVSHNTGRDSDIASIRFFLDGVDDLEAKEYYKLLLTKKLKLGVSADTWNKLCKKEDIIPVFDVMLAKKYEDHASKIKGNFCITKKLDGNRAVIIKRDGITETFTRTGQKYNGLSHIEEEINRCSKNNFVLDGELISDVVGNTLEVFSETTSLARKKNEKDKTSLIFHAFDIIPLHEFEHGESTYKALERKQILKTFIDENNFEYIKNVDVLYSGNDIEKIVEFSNYAKQQLWEGIMVNLDEKYVCKRTDTLLKVKEMKTCDIRVIGFEEGSGRNEGTLGAIICDYKGNPTKVGSGFSDDLRSEIWDNRDVWLGKIIEISYFEESQDSKTKIKSLRFPVFKKIRNDKNKESYY